MLCPCKNHILEGKKYLCEDAYNYILSFLNCYDEYTDELHTVAIRAVNYGERGNPSKSNEILSYNEYAATQEESLNYYVNEYAKKISEQLGGKKPISTRAKSSVEFLKENLSLVTESKLSAEIYKRFRRLSVLIKETIDRPEAKNLLGICKCKNPLYLTKHDREKIVIKCDTCGEYYKKKDLEIHRKAALLAKLATKTEIYEALKWTSDELPDNFIESMDKQGRLKKLANYGDPLYSVREILYIYEHLKGSENSFQEVALEL